MAKKHHSPEIKQYPVALHRATAAHVQSSFHLVSRRQQISVQAMPAKVRKWSALRS